MSTIKKTSSIIVSAVIIAGIAFGLVDYLKPAQNEILHQFTLDAVYLKNDQWCNAPWLPAFQSPYCGHPDA